MYNGKTIIVNPFVFPSEILFYFILLLMIVFAPVLSLLFPILRLLFHASSSTPSDIYWGAIIILLSLISLPILTFILYRKETEKLIRGKRKIEEKYPEISNSILNLSQKMGIRAPICLCSDGEELDALSFGYAGEKYLLISKGLCEKFKTFPTLVETVLIHELSHIKNKDVIQHQIAESLWKSFCLVALVVSLCGVAISRDLYYAFHWLMLVLIFYLLPSAGIFYLNNAIRRWREIYADIRTIAFQKTSKNLMTFLNLLSLTSLSSPRRKFITKFFSPFIPSPSQRVKIIKEGAFKHILERATLSIVISILSLYSISASTVFSGVINETLHGVVIFLLWFSLSFLLFSMILLPYWAYSFNKIKTGREYISETIKECLKVSLMFSLPLIIFLPMVFTVKVMDALFSLFSMNFLFVVIHRLSFNEIISLDSHRFSAKKKVFFSELIILGILIGFAVYYFLGPLYLDYAIFYTIILLSTLISLAMKYLKCPYCGKSVEPYSIFICPYCSHRINEEFLIFLKE